MRKTALVVLLCGLALGCRQSDPQRQRQQGEALFLRTARAAPGLVPASQLACASCHTHEGRRDRALPLDGVARRYPAFSARDNRRVTLQDRIRGCFQRSLNGTGPADESEEMLALVVYLGQIPEGSGPGLRLPPEPEQVAVEELSGDNGRRLYQQRCTPCHGPDGQGNPPLFPPLWGPRSFNDGAGLARVYTLAAFIHEAMPLNQAGSLSWREAQELARFIDSQPRPQYAGKSQDYAGGGLPRDAVYYRL